MKLRLGLAIGLVLWCIHKADAAEAAPASLATRQKLAEAILREGQEQQKLLSELADSGSKIASEVLNAWSHDGVFIYTNAESAKIPVVLEDAEDSSGKHRALRIDDGEPLKDGQGADLRFGPNELTGAETDMRLRSAIQQTLD